MAPLLLFVLAIIGASTTLAAELRVGVHFYDPKFETPDGSGFEYAFVRNVCDSLSNETYSGCKYIPISFEERITALQKGTADLTFGCFSVTPERSQIVDFVRPFVYSVGATIFGSSSANAAQLSSTGWAGLKGKSICAIQGYYCLEDLKRDYGLQIVEVSSNDEADAKMQAGGCIGMLNDATTSYEGWVLTDLPQQYAAPYGIAVAKGNTTLRHTISALLVDQFTQQSVGEAPALGYAKEYLLPAGVTSPQLKGVVGAISDFNAGTGTCPPSSSSNNRAVYTAVGLGWLALIGFGF